MTRGTRLGFSAENRIASVFDIPRLTLRKGERVRIVILETDALSMLRHWVNGVGYIECHGEFDKIRDLGTDPDKCPLCNIASPVRDSGMPSMPKRSFINCILKYLVDTRGVPLQPVAAQIVVWVYGEDKFGMLINAAQEWDDLRKHDLQITCSEEKFQRFDMTVAKSAFWLQDDPTRQRIAALYKAEKPKDEDMLRVLGRTLELPQLEDIVRRLKSGQLGGGVVHSVDETDVPEVSGFSVPEGTAELPEGAITPAGTLDFDDLLKT